MTSHEGDWRDKFQKVFLWSILPLSLIIYTAFTLMLTALIVGAIIK